ncbi:hypothetical protein LPE509_02153 [Legionella pneumophila subsp. pneumophila LPE509]|nr:hypothetical protein LPE509_02153 [Legionella pneumophila subsp. pneumophila LPE509]
MRNISPINDLVHWGVELSLPKKILPHVFRMGTIYLTILG